MQQIPDFMLVPHLPGGLSADDFEAEDGRYRLKPGSRARWLDAGEKPALPYYIEFADGRRAEAATPHHLMDILIHPEFTAVEEYADLYYYFTLKRLRLLAAAELAMAGIRATVYDRLGPFFDPILSRKPDEEEEPSFENRDNPVILDGFNWWTAVADMIRIGYIRLYEKIPTWTGTVEKKKALCKNCVFKGQSLPPDEEGDTPFWCHAWGAVMEETDVRTCPYVTGDAPMSEYRLATPEQLPDPSGWIPNWVPIRERTKEYEGFRTRPGRAGKR